LLPVAASKATVTNRVLSQHPSLHTVHMPVRHAGFNMKLYSMQHYGMCPTNTDKAHSAPHPARCLCTQPAVILQTICSAIPTQNVHQNDTRSTTTPAVQVQPTVLLHMHQPNTRSITNDSVEHMSCDSHVNSVPTTWDVIVNHLGCYSQPPGML